MYSKVRPIDWLGTWSRIWNLPTLSESVQITQSPRLRRSLGRCHPTTGVVRLHPALFTGPIALLREVTCHEVAHVAVHLLHGRGPRPHGNEWASLMKAAGYEPRARFDPRRLPAELQDAVKPKRLYRHHCPRCSAARIARKMVRRWRCRACLEAGLKGYLRITAIPAAEIPNV